MTTLVTVFRSTDTGAPTLSGTAGDLINVLSHCLIIGKCFTTADDVSFNDRTNAVRLSDASGSVLFPTPATGDRAYFGHSVRFTNLTFTFATLGGAATYIWEYWNGSTWTTLTVTDGTSGFTVAGSVTWSVPGSWATTTVNSSTMYFVRVRISGSTPSPNPSVDTASYLSWLEVQSGSNQRDYVQGTGSNSFIMSVNDNTPSVANEARVKCFETSTGLGTGNNSWIPTGAFIAAQTYGVIRKSNVASAATRSWIIIADKRTMYLLTLTTDSPNVYLGAMFGEFYSLRTDFADPGRCMYTGRFAENSAVVSLSTEGLSCTITLGTSSGVVHVIARDYQGTPGGLAGRGKMGDFYFYAAQNAATAAGNIGALAYPNPADNRIYIAPFAFSEGGATPILRGRVRGMYQWGHAASAVSDGDTFNGTGDLAGKSFLVVKSGPASDLYIFETSDTWETN